MIKPTYCLSLNEDIEEHIGTFIKHPIKEEREYAAKNLYALINATLIDDMSKLYNENLGAKLQCMMELNSQYQNKQHEFKLDEYFSSIKKIAPSNVLKYPSGVMLYLGCISDEYHSLLTQIRLFPVVKKLGYSVVF